MTKTETPTGIRTTMTQLAKDYADAVASGNETFAAELAARYNRYATRYNFDPLV